MSYFTKEENKKLCEKYPFLIPKNRWTGEVSPDYDYSWTEIDLMPKGWFDAFGMQMLEELKQALGDYVSKYRITDIKEKYGSLRWYDAGCTEEGYNVINKYSRLSEVTCIVCGQPAAMISSGWISPYCAEHAPSGKPYAIIVDGKIISDYYTDSEDEE